MSAGRVRLSAAAARRAVAEHGTPCYVQDLDLVRERFNRLRAALPPFAEPFYAMKANPHRAVVETLVAAGAGLEVASLGELELARSTGLAPRRIAFAGPAKRDRELRAALELGVVLNVESAGELVRAERIAGDLGIECDVSVRVSPPWGVEEEVSIIGGSAPTKFGVDLDQIGDFFAVASRLTCLRITGIHVFCASNVLDAKKLGEMWGRVLGLATELARDYAFELHEVDVGGGLGVPYRPDQGELDVARLGELLAEAYRARFGSSGPRVVLEPGRHLVAEAGTFITQVIDRKSCRGREYVLCDGGINNLLRPALIGQAHPMVVVGRETEESAGEFDVAGPLCTSLDFLARGVRLPDPQPGDLIAIACAGAYGYTESMLDFLSHPHPAQVMLG